MVNRLIEFTLSFLKVNSINRFTILALFQKSRVFDWPVCLVVRDPDC